LGSHGPQYTGKLSDRNKGTWSNGEKPLAKPPKENDKKRDKSFKQRDKIVHSAVIFQ
jgi:hypothetical protein